MKVADLEKMGIKVRIKDDGKNLGLSPSKLVTADIRNAVRSNKNNLLNELKESSIHLLGGPGTELKKIIPDVFATQGCGCKDFARTMDRWGIAKCEENFNYIVRYLVSKAHLFPSFLTKPVVSRWLRQAIENARNTGELTAVWVYWQGAAVADEIRYSIRSAEENLGDLGNVVICGDKPSWYDGHHIPSPRFNRNDARLEFGTGKFCKWIDSVVKLQRVLDDPNVTDTFLWMYDDTFIVRPSTIRELSVPRADGQLHKGDIHTPVKRKWREVMRRTHLALHNRGMTAFNYSTHYPVVYSKQLLEQTIKEFNARKSARLIESLYMNQHHGHPTERTTKVFQYSRAIRQNWSVRPDVQVVNIGTFNHTAQAVLKPMFDQKSETESD